MSLNHHHTLVSHLVNGAGNINHTFALGLFQDDIHSNERPSATHSSTGRGRGEYIYDQATIVLTCSGLQLVLVMDYALASLACGS